MGKYINAIQLNSGTFKIDLLYKPTKKIKICVSKGSNLNYYDIDESIVVPIYYGKGQYIITLYENVVNKKYSIKERIRLSIKNNDESYKVLSNTYVPYDESSLFYSLALELQTIEEIYNYIVKNIRYDFIAALSAKKNKAMPNPEQCFTTKRGICQDIAALMVAMLRINKIEANLIIGYADKTYHAWVSVNDKLYDPTKKILGNNKKIKYSSERKY